MARKTATEAAQIPAHHQAKLEELASRLAQVQLGGGEKAIAKHKAKGKWTARERVDYLLDNPAEAVEVGAFVAEGMYPEYGGCPGAGLVVKVGQVQGRMCVIVANDATVKAGAWFPITAKKNLRAQEISIENRLPIIYLVDSAGVFLPLQHEVFADKEHFGRTFRNNAVMSSMGIPQVAAIMGPCVAGGAYLPIMSDEALIVDGQGYVFLAGPYLVKSAIGETVDIETLGGATTHTEISGVTDYKTKDDKECLDVVKSLVAKQGRTPLAGFDRAAAQAPKLAPEAIFSILPDAPHKPYDTYQLLDWLVDEGSVDEYKKGYGQTILTAYARIDGWAVGIVANNRNHPIKSKKGEMQFGGVIYSDSADKAARFIMNCNQKRIPLVFLHDVTGFMVGSRSEHGGIIKDGAKMVNAVSNSVVPKFSFVMQNSYGAGNYAMCGKSYDPRLIFAWHTAQIAVMSGKSAANTLLQIQVSAAEAKGKELTSEEKNALLAKIEQTYNETLSPYYAAARLWVDGVIDPRATRHIISVGIEAANQNHEVPRFNPGVIQV